MNDDTDADDDDSFTDLIKKNGGQTQLFLQAQHLQMAHQSLERMVLSQLVLMVLILTQLIRLQQMNWTQAIK